MFSTVIFSFVVCIILLANILWQGDKSTLMGQDNPKWYAITLFASSIVAFCCCGIIFLVYFFKWVEILIKG